VPNLSHLHTFLYIPDELPRVKKLSPLVKPPIPKLRTWEPNGLSMISLFSGAFGLDLGFMAAGFELKIANDIDISSKNVADKNLPHIPFVHESIDDISCQDILSTAGLGIKEVDVLVGGPPCQPFSTAGKRGGLNDPRSSPLVGFVRVINEIQPRAFVMEEVTGLLSSRLKHVPISERNIRSLKAEEQKGSVFKIILEMLSKTGYSIQYGILNARDYGAPQSRDRVIIIGLREGKPTLPSPTHTGSAQTSLLHKGTHQIYTTFWEAVADLSKKEHEASKLIKSRAQYMKLVPPGGHWRHLPKEMVKEAMGGAYQSGGGKMGFYRRLPWDEVSPTVITSPLQKGSMLCHPEANRPLNIPEYRRMQGFPDDWVLPGSTATKYKLIGNAVPVHLSIVNPNVKTTK
jgi:DNA (cytosine-5)-methyltransferase 1